MKCSPHDEPSKPVLLWSSSKGRQQDGKLPIRTGRRFSKSIAFGRGHDVRQKRKESILTIS
jgi:hypothetical protein